jgi:hypothetical protein
LVEHLDEINDCAALPHAMIEPDIFCRVDLKRGRSLTGSKRTHIPVIISADTGWFMAKSPEKFNEWYLLGLVAVHIEKGKKNILAGQ